MPHPSGDGSFYAPIAQGLSESQAKSIVEACNQHTALLADRERLDLIEKMANDCEGRLLTRLFLPDGKPFREKIDALRALLKEPSP